MRTEPLLRGLLDSFRLRMHYSCRCFGSQSLYKCHIFWLLSFGGSHTYFVPDRTACNKKTNKNPHTSSPRCFICFEFWMAISQRFLTVSSLNSLILCSIKHTCSFWNSWAAVCLDVQLYPINLEVPFIDFLLSVYIQDLELGKVILSVPLYVNIIQNMLMSTYSSPSTVFQIYCKVLGSSLPVLPSGGALGPCSLPSTTDVAGHLTPTATHTVGAFDRPFP